MAFLLALILLLVFGAGGTSSAGGSVSAPQPQLELGLRDSGRTIELPRGQGAVLRLPDRWAWSETTEGSAVDLSTISSLRDTGFTEWSLVAAQPGTWEFRARGEPGGKRFDVTVRVR